MSNEVIHLDEQASPRFVLTAALMKANDDYAKEGFLYSSALVYHGHKATAVNKREDESVDKWTRRIQRFATKKNAYAACKLGIVHATVGLKSLQRFALVQVEHKGTGKALWTAPAGEKGEPLFFAADLMDTGAGHWGEQLLP